MSQSLKNLVKDQQATFQYFQEGNLWYKTDNGFEFPIPVSDTGNGAFRAQDKAIFFMRWIRQHLDYIQDSETKEGIKETR